MVEYILKAAIRVYNLATSLLMGYVITPFIDMIVDIFPDLNSYLTTFEYFLARFLHGIAFAREVFLNVTGFPRTLYHLLIVFVFARVTLMFFIRGYRFIMNSWAWFRTGRAINNTLNN